MMFRSAFLIKKIQASHFKFIWHFLRTVEEFYYFQSSLGVSDNLLNNDLLLTNFCYRCKWDELVPLTSYVIFLLYWCKYLMQNIFFFNYGRIEPYLSIMEILISSVFPSVLVLKRFWSLRSEELKGRNKIIVNPNQRNQRTEHPWKKLT